MYSWNQLKANLSALEASKPEDAVKYSFQKSPSVSKYYLAYRWVCFALYAIIATVSLVGIFHPTEYRAIVSTSPKWLLYLSSWSMVANLVQSIMGGVALTMAYNRRLMVTDSTMAYGVSNKFLKYYTIASMVASNLALSTIVNTVVLFDFFKSVPFDKMLFLELGAGSVLTLVDMFVVKFWYKMVSGLYSCGVVLSYFLMTWLYHHTNPLNHRGSSHIYPALHWDKPSEAAATVGISLFHLAIINSSILWGLSQLKRAMEAYQGGGSQQMDPMGNPRSEKVEHQHTKKQSQESHGEPSNRQKKSTSPEVAAEAKDELNTPADPELDNLNSQIENLENILQQVTQQSPKPNSKEIKDATKAVKQAIKKRDEYMRQMQKKN